MAQAQLERECKRLNSYRVKHPMVGAQVVKAATIEEAKVEALRKKFPTESQSEDWLKAMLAMPIRVAALPDSKTLHAETEGGPPVSRGADEKAKAAKAALKARVEKMKQ